MTYCFGRLLQRNLLQARFHTRTKSIPKFGDFTTKRTMITSVRILTTSTVDSSPSVLFIVSDGSKILVNCGEGCQRSIVEFQQRLPSIKVICLTHLCPDATGGLPGAILTSADSAATAIANQVMIEKQQRQQRQQGEEPLPEMELVGPPGTKQFVHSFRHFMRREKFDLHVHEGPGNKVFLRQSKSKRVNKGQPSYSIESLLFYEEQSSDDETASSDMPQELPFSLDEETQQQSSSIFSRIRQALSFQEDQSGGNESASPVASRKRPLSSDEQHTQQLPGSRARKTLSFIVSTPRIPGRFMADKAAALGVPKGPLRGQLVAGKSVSFTDKEGNRKTVHSSEVVMPSSPPVAVMVLYYPTSALARQVFSSDKLQSVADPSSNDARRLDLVIHMAPRRLFEEFGRSFCKEKAGDSNNAAVEHIFLSTDRSEGDLDGTPFRSAGVGAISRELLCKELFISPRPPATSDGEVTVPRDYRVGRPLLEYVLTPRAKKGFMPLDPYNIDAAKDEATKCAESTGAVALSKQILASSDVMASATPKGELVFAGTGSAIPCKHRNVSGILLRQADGRSILLDAGEGTLGQLLRMQSRNNKEEDVLGDIKAAWISHPHADHHLGILRLLRERRAPDPVLLLAPKPLLDFLQEYTLIDPSIRDTYEAIDSRDIVGQNDQVRAKIQMTLGLTDCRAVAVQHCPHAYAVILDGTSFGRLVYSGDCRPSQKLAYAARGADLLIHEATFEDGMEAEAALKRHSTVGEALTVARDMEAKCTILTHFSQRYPKIPPVPDSAHSFPVIFAFDYMRLKPSSLLAASQLIPALRLLFPEEEEEEGAAEASNVAEEAMSVPGVFAKSSLL